MGPWDTGTLVCVKCRHVARGRAGTCPICRQTMQHMYYTWRAPKKTNDKAWKLIENGQWLWDRHAVDTKAIEWARHIRKMREHMRLKRRKK